MSTPAQAAERSRERLRSLPLGAVLLEIARRQEGMWLVGGAVRDLLLERRPRELDVVVEVDLEAVLDGFPAEARVRRHERFGTATVELPAGRIDLARARVEGYPRPGALPQVRAGSLAEDLRRRDFTVNAIAVPLSGGEALAVEGAFEDLDRATLRVLHPESFREDPTRVLRLARYGARLGFAIDPATLARAREAVSAGALATVSGSRVGAELRLALGEPDPPAALGELARLGVLAALEPTLTAEVAVAEEGIEILAGAGEAGLLALAACALQTPAAALRALLALLALPAPERDVVLDAATGTQGLATALWRAQRPSEVRAAVQGRSAEAVALAGALGAQRIAAPDAPEAAANARRWLLELRHVRLELTGDALLARGVDAGPEVGRRLSRVLDQRLDGEIAPGLAAELAAALSD